MVNTFLVNNPHWRHDGWALSGWSLQPHQSLFNTSVCTVMSDSLVANIYNLLHNIYWCIDLWVHFVHWWHCHCGWQGNQSAKTEHVDKSKHTMYVAWVEPVVVYEKLHLFWWPWRAILNISQHYQVWIKFAVNVLTWYSLIWFILYTGKPHRVATKTPFVTKKATLLGCLSVGIGIQAAWIKQGANVEGHDLCVEV